MIYRALLLAFVASFLMIVPSFAIDVNLANSREWTDVFSVMLYSAQNNHVATFTNTESIVALSRTITADSELTIFESNNPYIRNLASQFQSSGYIVSNSQRENSFNLALDPQNGRYIVLSESNFRMAASLASYARESNSWVLFVNNQNVNAVAQRLANAQSVLAVGQFPRSELASIEQYFTERINTQSIYEDSHQIARKFGSFESVVLADGSTIESEFFSTKNPVLLSGYNRILDNTYDFLVSAGVKNVVIVGNSLTVIGEQIRTRSDRQISVFVKFGQSDTRNIGSVNALTVLQLPRPVILLNITKASYDPRTQKITAIFENIGNTGLYTLTTIVARAGTEQVATASLDEPLFVAAGEVIPVQFDAAIATEFLQQSLAGEFFTAFGASPVELDSFLTLENRFGPPFSIPITIEQLADDAAVISLDSIAYYPGLKRIGVDITSNSTQPVYYTVKVNGLIVNGLATDYAKKDVVSAQTTRRTYIPAILDKVDLEENTVFRVTINYGTNPDLALKTISVVRPFTTAAGGIPYLYIGIAVLIIAVIITLIFFFKQRR